MGKRAYAERANAACPKCGWVIDYGCGCDGLRPTLPAVEYGTVPIRTGRPRLPTWEEMGWPFVASR